MNSNCSLKCCKSNPGIPLWAQAQETEKIGETRGKEKFFAPGGIRTQHTESATKPEASSLWVI